MKKIVFIIGVISLFPFRLEAQEAKPYQPLKTYENNPQETGIDNLTKLYEKELSFFPLFQRDSLQKSGNYQQSLQNNLRDLDVKTTSRNLYQAAVNYALLNRTDSAFYYLNRYVNFAPDDRIILMDDAFSGLHNTKEWQELTGRIEHLYLQTLAPSVDQELALALFHLNILLKKQHLASYLFTSCFYKGKDTCFDKKTYNRELEQIRKRMNDIIRQYGFPNITNAGRLGEKTGIEASVTHMSNYYLKKAYKKGIIEPAVYAIATDRRMIRKKGKQQYGTQAYPEINSAGKKVNFTGRYFLCPIEDFANVNSRRAKMGFTETVEEYAKSKGYIIPEKYHEK